MQHVHLFSYNIPAENQTNGQPDKFIHVIAEWNGGFFDSGKPMVYITPVNATFYEINLVKNWRKATNEIEQIAENHFADLAKQERINQARAILAVEENPVLNRYEENNAILLNGIQLID